MHAPSNVVVIVQVDCVQIGEAFFLKGAPRLCAYQLELVEI